MDERDGIRIGQGLSLGDEFVEVVGLRAGHLTHGEAVEESKAASTGSRCASIKCSAGQDSASSESESC